MCRWHEINIILQYRRGKTREIICHKKLARKEFKKISGLESKGISFGLGNTVLSFWGASSYVLEMNWIYNCRHENNTLLNIISILWLEILTLHQRMQMVTIHGERRPKITQMPLKQMSLSKVCYSTQINSVSIHITVTGGKGGEGSWPDGQGGSYHMALGLQRDHQRDRHLGQQCLLFPGGKPN